MEGDHTFNIRWWVKNVKNCVSLESLLDNGYLASNRLMCSVIYKCAVLGIGERKKERKGIGWSGQVPCPNRRTKGGFFI